jgi:hypothetical protein
MLQQFCRFPKGIGTFPQEISRFLKGIAGFLQEISRFLKGIFLCLEGIASTFPPSADGVGWRLALVPPGQVIQGGTGRDRLREGVARRITLRRS